MKVEGAISPSIWGGMKVEGAISWISYQQAMEIPVVLCVVFRGERILLSKEGMAQGLGRPLPQS